MGELRERQAGKLGGLRGLLRRVVHDEIIVDGSNSLT